MHSFSGVREEDKMIDVVPHQDIGLSQALKFLSKDGRVGGEKPKTPLNLCEVRHGKWDW